MKKCVRKGHLKSKDEFSKSKNNKDGLQSWFKECNKEYQRERHMIKNNFWKLYRGIINLQGLNQNLEFGNLNNLKCNKLHYIGITKNT